MRKAWAFEAPLCTAHRPADYRQHIRPFETPLAGLYVANMFQVYPLDRGQNYSITLAERLAKRLAR